MAEPSQGARGFDGENWFQPNNEPDRFTHLETYACVQNIRKHYYAAEVLGILLEYFKKGNCVIEASQEEIAKLRNDHLHKLLHNLTKAHHHMETELGQNKRSFEKLSDENENRKDDSEVLAGPAKKRKVEVAFLSVSHDAQSTKPKRKRLQDLQKESLAKDYERLSDNAMQNILDLQSADLRAEKMSTQNAEENSADSFSTPPSEARQYPVQNQSLNLVGEKHADKNT